MENNPGHQKLYKCFITVLVVILALSAFVLYPRGPYGILDGGSEVYNGFFYVYTVTFLNQLPSSFDENGVGYYQKGTVITVLGRVVYSDIHPDYSKPLIMRRNQADIEKIQEEIERAMAGKEKPKGMDR